MPETDYAKTHCTQCKYGWSRGMSEGPEILFCLLDKKPVPKNMAHCNRYELKPESRAI